MTTALVLHATEISHKYFYPKLKIENRLLPREVPENHLRIQPKVVGICGSDIHMVRTREDSQQIAFSAPMSISQQGRVIGHEGICQVIAVGSHVSDYKIGDWVVPSSIFNCGVCNPCTRGYFNQCTEAKLLGTQIDGLFTNLIDLNSRLFINVTKYIKNEQSLIAFSALEPAATSLQACDIALLSPNKNVIIFGAGPIGAYAAMLAKLIFKCDVIVVIEPSKKRRGLVEPWASSTYETFTDFLNSDFNFQEFDAVIEASGYLDNITKVFKSIKPLGNVVLLARSGKSLNLQYVDHLITNAISIKGCRGQLGGYMSRIADLYDSGVLPLNELIQPAGNGLENLLDLLQNCPSKILERYCKPIITL